MNSRRMGSHLVWNSVRVIAAQCPEMVLGAEADSRVPMAFEACEVDKIRRVCHRGRQVRRIPATQLDRQFLRPMNDSRRVPNILFSPILLNPVHDMYVRKFGLAFS